MTDASAARPPADLYLDLLIRSIANTIYRDPPQDPWSTSSGVKYTEESREEGRDWPTDAHSMIGLKRLRSLRELCERAFGGG